MLKHFVRMEAYEGVPMSILLKRKSNTLTVYVNIVNAEGVHSFAGSTTEYDDVDRARDALEYVIRSFDRTKMGITSRRVIF